MAMEDAPTSSAPPSGRVEEADSRNSLRHILADPTMEDSNKASPSVANTPAPEDSEAGGDVPDGSRPATDTDAPRPYYTATTTTTRRNANGSVSSVYSGNKIKHLKKDDGIPLWRKDIQYDFLKLVFEDDKPVFTKQSDGTSGHTFADIYLDAMAGSSKCSKILKDKLLTERPAAINMAMVCLLVNVGRMNTTLNFFPEMRAQLRTYHSIPSLQAHQDPNAYKQLQDAPRLKSILKGATEDREQPSTIEEIMAATIPRTNPVNLIFVLSQYAPKISELHFFPPRDFFDLVMRPNLSSRSRATAFLWLMWWYLESDFSKHAAENNPFGHGQLGPADDPATADFPIKCPPFDILTPDQEALENVDTPEEKNFGEIKRKERTAILASDMAPVVTGPKRTNKKAFNQNPVFSVIADDGASTPGRDRQSPSHGSARGRTKLAKSLLERDYASDTDRTRSASPPNSVYNTTSKQHAATPNMRINTLLNDDAGPSSSPAPKGPGRGNWSRNRSSGLHHPGSAARTFKSRLDATASQDGASPSTSAPTFNGPHGFYLPLNGSDPSHKRTRPLTQHQLAVEQYRRRRVDVILARSLRKEYALASRRRRRANPIMLSWIRCKGMPDGYDTDEETHSLGKYYGGTADSGAGGAMDLSKTQTPPPMPAGLVPLDFGGEVNDHGEESYYRAKMLGRALRRVERWEGRRGTGRRTRGKDKSKSGPDDERVAHPDADADADEALDAANLEESQRQQHRRLLREEETESEDEIMRDVDRDADADADPDPDAEDREVLLGRGEGSPDADGDAEEPGDEHAASDDDTDEERGWDGEGRSLPGSRALR
ncbi:hypothetical protein IAQ61_007849 [Plenodomus lingam]|uniref:Predicted protein n=1 Tax=Leptosphaeria maculans (strain JN3 / isolate v23.1.3 / race Av1-4-5-6-7-8) TaxID=985895 RepID=E5A4H4_LEPMJ|nr:predicted protein [Plenodomus lingam JN3]KAH9867257.1 hypothetical protein IAQ61_007849 [Plenodomus lingam]CBX98522.1 predicted protein [Plenodomus lingam JN3]